MTSLNNEVSYAVGVVNTVLHFRVLHQNAGSVSADAVHVRSMMYAYDADAEANQ